MQLSQRPVQLLQASLEALQSEQPAPVQVSAVAAIRGFCLALKQEGAQEAVVAGAGLIGSIFEVLCPLATKVDGGARSASRPAEAAEGAPARAAACPRVAVWGGRPCSRPRRPREESDYRQHDEAHGDDHDGESRERGCE